MAFIRCGIKKRLTQDYSGAGQHSQSPGQVIMTRMPNIITTNMEETVIDAVKRL